MALVGNHLVPHPSRDGGREVNVVVAADVPPVIDAFVSALDDSLIPRPD